MSDTRPAVVVRWATGVLAVLILVAIGVVAAVTDDPDRIVLVGTLDSLQLAVVLALIGCVDLAVFAFSIRVSHPLARAGVILARVAATVSVVVAGGVAMLATLETSHVSAIIDDEGCDTGYVVRETESYGGGAGAVYLVNGVVATAHGSTPTGPVATPFHDGAYTAAVVDHVLLVSYASVAGGPIDESSRLTLTPYEDVYGPCGLSRPSYVPSPVAPTPTPKPPFTLVDAEGVMAGMYRQTQNVIPGAQDANGDPWVPVAPTRRACDADSMQSTVPAEFATSDNAAAVARILATWDAAGFDTDRAIQTDIRFDPDSGVTLRISDRSTIDGLIHLSITTPCLPVEEAEGR